ncbi:Protein bem46 [Nosema bombycis CQ1]|uniref:Protein bem46 n=1 Tax=Nosema bombycis (strain CQ1 / CVCC 102059) TaxID=578461 RepID=R0MLY3_NOSB1|nr:Protein bem46 [Nosema bombycis CQ1]|eukprot:EOB15255.1 Protein bem46 [Nosema bombycis CQ1]
MDKYNSRKRFIKICYSMVLLSLSIFLHFNQGLFLFQRNLTFKFKDDELIDVYTNIKSHDGKDINLYFHDRNSDIDLIFIHGSRVSGKIYKKILEQIAEKTNCNVFGFYLRGVNNKRGEPSEKGICIEAKKVGDYIKSRNKKVFIYGQSLGSSVALSLGIHLRVKDLILENPFTTFGTIVNYLKFLSYFSYLVVDKWDNIEKIKRHNGRVLFFISEFDKLVPNEESQTLANHHENSKIIKLKNSTHFNVQQNEMFYEHLNDFIYSK